VLFRGDGKASELVVLSYYCKLALLYLLHITCWCPALADIDHIMETIYGQNFQENTCRKLLCYEQYPQSRG